jgi:hypothetical protein
MPVPSAPATGSFTSALKHATGATSDDGSPDDGAPSTAESTRVTEKDKP